MASITSALIGAGVAPVADHAGIHAAPISKLDIKAAAVVLTIFIWFYSNLLLMRMFLAQVMYRNFPQNIPEREGGYVRLLSSYESCGRDLERLRGEAMETCG